MRQLTATVAKVAIFFAILAPVIAHADDKTGVIANSAIPSVFSSIGKTPQWVYDHFGKPEAVFQNTLCCEFQGYSNRTTLIHSYGLDGGGQLAFLYAMPVNGSDWEVVGVAYDSLMSGQYQQVSDFVKNGDPRVTRIATCIGSNFSHHSYGTSPIAVDAVWKTSNGDTVYAKYLPTEPLARKYDPVSGKDIPQIPTDFDGDHLVQLGYFRSPLQIIDLHVVSANDDFSITRWGKACRTETDW